MTTAVADAVGIAAAVRAGHLRARDTVEAALARIASLDGELNCFTAVLADSARTAAREIDAAIDAARDPGPLAGVPFGVKDLFDVAGLPTRAGSKIRRDRPAAARDAAAIRALARAGAILVGTLNMDEYAFGWTTENTHYGPTRNPHDRTRTAGGSSGGAGAAVAAGLVPLALGSDTNGSVRVPASFCGVFGLKPTYGRVSRAGAVLLAPSLDHVGPLARSARDLATAYDALQGPDPDDPACSDTPPDPTLPHLGRGVADLRFAAIDDDFLEDAVPEARVALDLVAAVFGATRRLHLPEVRRARAAATLITASEAATCHLADLRRRARDFDPLIRDRLLAGALLPATLHLQAQRFRAWYRLEMQRLFREVDVVLTPTTPCFAPPLTPGGIDPAIRSRLGLFTQPFSFIGLPALSVPVLRAGTLRLGVQLVAAPFEEARLLRAAVALEGAGVVAL